MCDAGRVKKIRISECSFIFDEQIDSAAAPYLSLANDLI
jgi:hypothetical protein